jgi:lipopolysaccharide biosynthesis protein
MTNLFSEIHQLIDSGDFERVATDCEAIIKNASYPESLREYAAYLYRKYCSANGKSLAMMKQGLSTVDARQLNYGQFYERFEAGTLPSYIKTIAFYLPQFHEIPENNEWWGEGFTEWSNTSKAQPRFPSHYQPRVPHPDIGYYDLSKDEAIEKQVKLALSAGITGFCFYYYWFSGTKLLDTPIRNLVSRHDLDIGFFICWANENWTRAWDGLDREVLIQQKYEAGWDLDFIRDISELFKDKRYMRLYGKPIVIIYKLTEVPEPETVVNNWRNWCRENGFGEISVWAVYDNSFFNQEPSYIDRFIEFPPRPIATVEHLDKGAFGCNDEDSYLFNYQTFVDTILDNKALADNVSLPIHRCVMMGWDNSARRKGAFHAWADFRSDNFYQWCRKVWEYTVNTFPEQERFLFVNAWNEWAEGTYLEPDARFGYANINTLTRALRKLPNCTGVLRKEDTLNTAIFKLTIIVHIHLYFTDLLAEITASVNCIPVGHDIIITVCDEDSKNFVESHRHNFVHARNIDIRVVQNQGRDLGPFVVELADVLTNYDLVLHIHSKKSETVNWGHLWRKYLLRNLLGDRANVTSILNTFVHSPDIGVIGMPVYAPMSTHISWGPDQKQRCQSLLNECLGDASLVPPLPDHPDFSAGSFFWARTDSIRQLFSLGISYADFESEDKQVHSTLAHAVERIFPYLARSNQYSYEKVVNINRSAGTPQRKRVAIFVYFGNEDIVYAENEYYMSTLYADVDYLLVVSNSKLSVAERTSLEAVSDDILCRDNLGYDFGAWKDGMDHLGADKLANYDELLLVNSSCIGPFIPWSRVFETMEQRGDDFWGLTIFPELKNSDRPEASRFPENRIPRHIQSFFMAFTKEVFTSEAFLQYWNAVSFETSLIDVVAKFEGTLTEYLASHGFSYSAFVDDHEPFQLHASQHPNFNAIYNMPWQMLTLGSPVIKNKLNMMHEYQLCLVKEFLSIHTDYPASIYSRWH